MTPRHGLLVSIDGPGGSGKSTIAALVMEHLTSTGIAAHLTTEPSPTPLGKLIRAGTEEYAGMALACLVAGDRHHHPASEIRPALAAGKVVLCDRYVPASLVLQRMDGLSWDVILQLNAGTDRPALAVILNGDPNVIRTRLTARGGHSRFERQPGSTNEESRLYHDTAARLAEAGWPSWVIDITARSASDTAMMVAERIRQLHAAANPEQR
jgi:dTMP kinase